MLLLITLSSSIYPAYIAVNNFLTVIKNLSHIIYFLKHLEISLGLLKYEDVLSNILDNILDIRLY